MSLSHLVLTPREQYVYEFYKLAKVRMFGPYDYTMLAPASDQSIFLSDETRCLARVVGGDIFDRYVRYVALHGWWIALLLQVCCVPIGIYFLTSSSSSYFILFSLPGALFPMILLLRSHWRVLCYMFKQWEPMFLTFYALLFCVCNIILAHDGLAASFLLFVFFPTLLSCIFGDASSLRLDYAFIKGDISIAALALPPCVVSLAGLIALLLTNQGGLCDGVKFSLFHNYSGYARSLLSTTGITLCFFISRSIVHIIMTPHRCVSIRSALTISSVTVTPVVGSFSARSSLTLPIANQVSCSLKLTGHFDQSDDDIHLLRVVTESPLTHSVERTGDVSI